MGHTEKGEVVAGKWSLTFTEKNNNLLMPDEKQRLRMHDQKEDWEAKDIKEFNPKTFTRSSATRMFPLTYIPSDNYLASSQSSHYHCQVYLEKEMACLCSHVQLFLSQQTSLLPRNVYHIT
jgi:hypothetical protein